MVASIGQVHVHCNYPSSHFQMELKYMGKLMSLIKRHDCFHANKVIIKAEILPKISLITTHPSLNQMMNNFMLLNFDKLINHLPK